MPKLPKLPKLPNPEQIPGIFDRMTKGIDYASQLVEIVGMGVDKVADALGKDDGPPAATKERPLTKASAQTEPSAQPETPARDLESHTGGPSPAAVTETLPQENPTDQIATACVPCAIGHFAGAAKLLNEAIRFRDEGIGSNQVLDDIAGAIGELNAMERVDLTPERLQQTPEWQRAIAEESLRESRKLRHRLEGISSMEEIEKAAADTESYYKKLNRQWYKGRFSHLGAGKAEAIAQRVGK